MTRTLLALTLLASSLSPALAGIVDTPVPSGYNHIFSVAGVVNNGTLAAYFTCTNADTSSATIGVEVFGPTGGAPVNTFATTAISVAPGASVMFGTTGAVALSIDGNLALGPVSKGSARILATSKKLVCTAFLADPNGNPPVAGWQLTIVAKAKQKAAN